MNSRFFPALITVLTLTISSLTAPNGNCGAPVVATSSRSVTESGPGLFDVSVGYNYLHLDKATFEQEHLHGFDVSAFVNLSSWFGLGGDFMADFGQKTVRSGGRDFDLNNRRYVYVFGPRITLLQTPRYRVFAEALAGGVHAELDATLGSFTRSLEAKDAFAAAVGAGFDWRFSRLISWRVIQADYVPTALFSDWQSNFRASTGIVFSFGGK